MLSLDFDENTTYEVLITTVNMDYSLNTKPFGIRFKDNQIILKLFPNRTLKNIRNNSTFYIQLTSNPLLYTKALLNLLDEEDYVSSMYLKDTYCLIEARMKESVQLISDDGYSTTSITRITADITEISNLALVPININRATNRIIELLVKLSRLHLMNRKEIIDLREEVNDSYKFIIKEGTQMHIDSLSLIKKKVDSY